MSKKIISLFIVLSMCVMNFCLVSAEAPLSFSFDITGITATINGGTVAVINEAGTYQISVSVKASENVSASYLAVLLCEGTKEEYIVRDMAEIKDISLSKDAETIKTVSLTSSDSNEKFIKIISTSGEDKSIRIAEDAFFPTGDELKLKGITINGKLIEGFSKDIFSYEYTPLMTEVAPLTIVPLKICDVVEDNVINIDSYPGEIKITLSYGELTPVTYTIKVNEPKPTINWVLNTDNWTIAENIQNGTKPYRDSAATYNANSLSDFPQLAGMTAIQTVRSAGLTSGGVGPNADFIKDDDTDWAEIKIDNSAEIYIFYPYDVFSTSNVGMNWLKDDGYVGVIDADTPTATDGVSKFRISNTNTNVKSSFYVFKRTVQFPLGETRNIKFKTQGYNVQTYFVALKWIDNLSLVQGGGTQSLSLINEDDNNLLSNIDFTPATLSSSNDNNLLSASAEVYNTPSYTLTAKNNKGVLEGNNATVNSEILLKIYKPSVENGNATLKDVIYYNIVKADDEGKYSFKFLLEELRGEFSYKILSDENLYNYAGKFVFNPTGDNTIKSMKLNSQSCIINDNNITVTLPYNTYISGVNLEFEIHKDAKMYLNDTELISGQAKLNCSNPLTLKVVADDDSEKLYNLTVFITPKPIIPSGGGGGGGGGGSFNVSSSKEEEKEDIDEVVIPPVVRKLFSDVSGDNWAYDAIDYLNEKEILSGYEDGSFKPDGMVTRGEFIKIVVNAFSLLPSDKKVEFNDVNDNDWFKFYVDIAGGNGIVSGDNLGNFNPNGNITREDIATILYRALTLKGEKLSKDFKTFADSENISEYALNAVNALTAEGIMSGYPDNTLKPKNSATRAEVSMLIFKILNK